MLYVAMTIYIGTNRPTSIQGVMVGLEDLTQIGKYSCKFPSKCTENMSVLEKQPRSFLWRTFWPVLICIFPTFGLGRQVGDQWVI